MTRVMVIVVSSNLKWHLDKKNFHTWLYHITLQVQSCVQSNQFQLSVGQINFVIAPWKVNFSECHFIHIMQFVCIWIFIVFLLRTQNLLHVSCESLEDINSDWCHLMDLNNICVPRNIKLSSFDLIWILTGQHGRTNN